MMAIRRALPLLLPLIAGVAVAALVIVVVWVMPATEAGTVERTVVGPSRFLSWRNTGEERTERWEWRYNVEVEGDPSEVEVLPRMLFSFQEFGGSDSGTADLLADMRIYVNGQEAHHRRERATSREGTVGNYDYNTDSGVPGPGDEVRQGLLRAGDNEVHVVVDLRLEIQTSGTERFDVSFGPIHSYVYQADGDGDGVVDAHQVVPGLHTAFIALPAVGLLGGGAFALVRFLVRRRGVA